MVTKQNKEKAGNIRKSVKFKSGEGFYTKKERRQARLTSKKHAEVVTTLLADWEVLRRDTTETSKKHELVDKMLAAAKTKLMDLSQAHDTSRIIESMLQLGTEAQRWAIFAELRDRLRYLAMSQYGKHVVLKLVNYGAKEHRLELFKLFRGYVVKLLRHKHAAEVVEMLYNDYATAAQRALILQEVYGHQFALQLTANNVQRLQQALDLNPDKRATILANLNDLLVTMVSKGLIRLSIVQHLLLEYLTVMLQSSDLLKIQTTTTTTTKLVQDITDPTTEETPTPRREERLSALVEAILESGIVSMLHTREGVKAALAVLWICPPKERKTLLKSMRTCIVSTAENEHGHIFLMGLLDSVDDTKLLAKTIVKELLEDLEDVVCHPHARKVLLYALAPRDPRHFAPALISACLAGGDDSPFTKKPLAVRAIELRAPLIGLLPALLRLVTEPMGEEEGVEVGDPLIRLFVGSVEHPAPLVDRARVVLLAEILIRSSAYELQFSTAANCFKRTGSREAERLVAIDTKSSSLLTPEDLAVLRQARTRALRHFVTTVLAQPNFQPIGIPTPPSHFSASVEAKRMLQTQRRKRALAIAEAEGVKKRKVTVKAFTNVDEEEDGNEKLGNAAEPMDTSTADDDTLPANAPFLERLEGQLLVSRLLQNEKKSDSHEFARLVCELVPEQTLQAWLTCNRSCFALVHLYELNDEEICERLRKVLYSQKDLIMASPLPGAKILAKQLYLNEFRTTQCPLFLEQQCHNHRPYTCFYWHFPNQKRRRPIKKVDGTFNYNPDVYCDKYDENSGTCPDGDDCPYAHRNAGDTERRYHPRYFKTGNCIYETTESGACVKNGLHCAFAHGPDDLRLPVYDIREVQDASSSKVTVNLPASLEKERVLSEDPTWNDMLHVMARYKTESCRKPPRMCRQGYSCPYYHNGKDKRRMPERYFYRSTPCPAVRPADEWLDSALCDAGDACTFCHTRTEQQFHPELSLATNPDLSPIRSTANPFESHIK
ncbi:RING finger protein unkempt [Echinococcus granulosus]|uniref:RING finger protein unkempt n=1 Tax=Echinococcus granulosus TaxID=6210 RepID=W6UD36_ECHGR|nr:RING finger protein unkempt [Echinococcus granulosus]EUB56227.1 RING finger protein unkempt [Echinococcus granulosus]